MSDASGRVYFAQISDLHVGKYGMNPLEASGNLRWALGEIGGLQPRPAGILATADLVCGGRREELEVYAELAGESETPVYASVANHDRWGEADDAAVLELVGPLRQRVDLGPVTALLWDDTLRVEDGSWPARLGEEQREWLTQELEASRGQAVVVAHHVPMLAIDEEWHDKWRGSNAPEALKLFREYGVLATITGHWHRCGEWSSQGVRVINTGALCGWQYTGIVPHWGFPTLPGYRLFCYEEGELRTFWRDGSYWQGQAPDAQVTIEKIGGVHTGGPRPQVRPPMVAGSVKVTAKAFVRGGRAEAVEWSWRRGEWRGMTRIFDGLWSEWECELDGREMRPWGPYSLAVRLRGEGRDRAVDAVPVMVAERDAAPFCAEGALPGAEQLWTLFYPPEGD